MKSALLVIMAIAIVGTGIAADAPKGYLPPHSLDLTQILPPAPTVGDIRYETDRKVFRAMRAKIGSPRWAAAKVDVDYATPAIMHDFVCAAGLPLDPATFPATARLLENASADTGRANNDAKDIWKRLRPYHIDGGETCQAKKELGDSFDYPSGHTTKGWTVGLVLADLLPDRAAPIMARAREYGESRIVCRVHNMSGTDQRDGDDGRGARDARLSSRSRGGEGRTCGLAPRRAGGRALRRGESGAGAFGAGGVEGVGKSISSAERIVSTAYPCA